MKSDLHALMQAAGLDAILVTGPAQNNPTMVYLTGGGHLTNADLILKRGEEPILFYQPMERDEAARSGLQTRNLAGYRMDDLLQQANGDPAGAAALRYRQMLAEAGITAGRVALYGRVDIGGAFAAFTALQKAMPGLELVGETGLTALLQAMSTKDEQEVARIRRMGRITTEVVAQTADFLTSHRTREGVLVDGAGDPLTIGTVKNQIDLWLAQRGAANPEGTIFAIGRDAGVPHSSGTASDWLRLGQTIVYDIFPCEAGGGYHYDFTRTWCLGYASGEAQALYEDVLAVYREVMGSLKPGAPFAESQKLTCDLFEARGHATLRQDPQIQSGYVHSVGHGLGLYVHERPMSGSTATAGDRLNPGAVFTVEPGLYYPDRGLGVRLEDTVWARPDGQFEILADYPLDLVLPMK